MTEALYRERSEGPIARTHRTLPRKTKEGLIGQIENAFKKDMLAEKFPAHCKDGSTICGTDEGTAIRIIEAHVSGFEWPPREDIDDATLFDLIEFFAARVSTPKQGNYHEFYRHYELKFSEQEGKKCFREEIDLILKNGGTLFTLTTSGKIERIGTPELQEALSAQPSRTGDNTTDRLIDEARRLYRSPKATERQTGLEKLWDAFERIKTIEGEGDKKATTKALLQYIKSEPFRDYVNREMKQLTAIGNDFRIRHHEKSKHEISAPEAADYLFTRMSSLIMYLLKVSGRTGEVPQSAYSAQLDDIVF
ncbi:hypothetical protein [Actinomyces bowdenii]|uniref:Uncharacterized protein n=1 Tax=Actinomyces bowdenii TaxID=131109 RepID=A0A853EPC2_9ACTO|nr:hypothetical protein [Actinomyces bowdenii]MBF0697423.1 hypothetical protein [Actinomyces bowdenii]NYS69596.1 hypothetical protein [Actinomyces bowdenii]